MIKLIINEEIKKAGAIMSFLIYQAKRRKWSIIIIELIHEYLINLKTRENRNCTELAFPNWRSKLMENIFYHFEEYDVILL